MKAVILADGQFPTKESLLKELKEAEFLVVCDGAITYLDELNIKPNFIVGDLDSISNELKEKYSSKLVHIAEQMSNDLSKAFHYALFLGYKEFTILGATGKREDHALANISLLSVYHKKCDFVIMKDDYGEFTIHTTPFTMDCAKGEQISIFSLNPSAKLTSKGLMYPLKQLSLPIWANGTLNEALGDSFSLESNEESEIIIYKSPAKSALIF